MSRPKPVLLLILDGFGCREDAPDNAISRANMTRWRELLARSREEALGVLLACDAALRRRGTRPDRQGRPRRDRGSGCAGSASTRGR